MLYFYESNYRVIANYDFPDTEKDALEASIRKWEFIVAWLKEHPGQYLSDGSATTCALCRLYLDDNCLNCPVFKKTGFKWCRGTPYHDYESGDDLDYKTAAEQEVEFLKSLRTPEVDHSGE